MQKKNLHKYIFLSLNIIKAFGAPLLTVQHGGAHRLLRCSVTARACAAERHRRSISSGRGSESTSWREDVNANEFVMEDVNADEFVREDVNANEFVREDVNADEFDNYLKKNIFNDPITVDR